MSYKAMIFARTMNLVILQKTIGELRVLVLEEKHPF